MTCYAHPLMMRVTIGMTVCPGDPWWAYALRLVAPFLIVALPSLMVWRIFGWAWAARAMALLLTLGIWERWFPFVYAIPVMFLWLASLRPWEFRKDVQNATG